VFKNKEKEKRRKSNDILLPDLLLLPAFGRKSKELSKGRRETAFL